jgi:hypothetical protein
VKGGGDIPPPPNIVTYDTTPNYDSPTITQRENSIDLSDTPESRVIRVGYGWQKVTPPVCDAEINAGNVTDQRLHMVYDLGYGEVDSVVQVLHGADEIYPTAKAGFTVTVRLGTAAQTELTAVPNASWDSSFPGRALVYIIFDTLVADMTGGNPDITIIYKGRKCLDWRTSMTAWTENPFVIARDILMNSEFGARMVTADFDAASWTACANRCDEVVNGEARWRAAFAVTDRNTAIEVVRDLLKTTCAGFVYYADGQWYAGLDEQHVVGCRPLTGTTPVGTTDRAQSFTAPGLRIKAVLKLDLAGGFTLPTLRLRSTLAGADLATSTPAGLASGTNQEITFDLSAVRLTVGATYYLVLLATTGVTWHQTATSLYAGGCSWNYTGGAWVQESTKDFWTQVHYADHELCDYLTAVAGQMPLLPVGTDDVVTFSRAKTSAPRVVVVSCYDVADWIVKPMRYESADVMDGTVQPDELRQQMLACAGPGQGYRLALQWQRTTARSNMVSAAVPMHGCAIAPGDVVAVWCTTGSLVGKWFRVKGITQGFGKFSLALQEYDWTDFAREEVPVIDGATIPSASSKVKFQSIRDDFTSGDIVSGYVGEKGWTISGTPTLSYLTETDHAGIVHIDGAGGIALSNPGAMFAPDSVWRQKWIVRFGTLGSGTYYRGILGVFDWRFTRDSPAGTYSLWVDAVDTGVDFGANVWIVIEAWCAADGTAYWTATQGATVASGNKVVAVTTPTAYLSAFLSAGQLDVDFAEVKVPTAR